MGYITIKEQREAFEYAKEREFPVAPVRISPSVEVELEVDAIWINRLIQSKPYQWDHLRGILVKDFEFFLRKGDVKKQSPDKNLSDATFRDSLERLEFCLFYL